MWATNPARALHFQALISQLMGDPETRDISSLSEANLITKFLTQAAKCERPFTVQQHESGGQRFSVVTRTIDGSKYTVPENLTQELPPLAMELMGTLLKVLNG